MRYQGSDGAWPRCTDVGGGSIKLVAVQGTSGSHGLGQMQPILSVTGEELDIGTPLENVDHSRPLREIQSRDNHALAFIKARPARDSDQDLQAALAHPEDNIQLDNGPRPSAQDGEKIELKRHAATGTRRVWNERLQCLQTGGA